MTETAEIVARPTNITVYAYGMLDAPTSVDAAAVDRVYRALAESKLQGASPDKYGFVDLRRTEPLLIYGLFVHEYARELHGYDDSKAEITQDASDTVKYLFVLDLPNQRLLLQRRHRPYHTLPEWETIFDRFQTLLRYLIDSAGVHAPTQIVGVTIGETRDEFVAAFFDPSNVVEHVVLEDFAQNLIPPDFRYFNPREGLDEPFGEGIAETIPMTKRAIMDATPRGDLQHAPVARGLMRAAGHPISMRVRRKETSVIRTLQDVKEVRIETSIDIEGASPAEIGELMQRALQPGARLRRPPQPQTLNVPRNQPALFDSGGDDDAKA